METKTEIDGEHPSSHYLVVVDPGNPETWDLRVKDANGDLNDALMAKAWAALQGGYDGRFKVQALQRITELAEGFSQPRKQVRWHLIG